DTAPESGKPFKWFSRVGDNEDPKLKLGENEKGRLQPAREKTNCKGCLDNQQLRSNPALKLANAFGVSCQQRQANISRNRSILSYHGLWFGPGNS
ncbi:MAG TPA: hypothetical protein VFB70_01760, partial [Pyrinomonadaceae bacterium]|nr:hypothetical protein [Pyrinomonadaceae bacterium]